MSNKLLFIVAGLAGIMAFTNRPSDEQPELQTATYGVCDCEKSTANTSEFRLKINEDHTFRYTSSMNPKKKVDVTGKWEWNKKTIVLKDYPATANIHDKWKMETSYPCITSRKGLEFSRLCKMKKCD